MKIPEHMLGDIEFMEQDAVDEIMLSDMDKLRKRAERAEAQIAALTKERDEEPEYYRGCACVMLDPEKSTELETECLFHLGIRKERDALRDQIAALTKERDTWRDHCEELTQRCLAKDAQKRQQRAELAQYRWLKQNLDDSMDVADPRFIYRQASPTHPTSTEGGSDGG